VDYEAMTAGELQKECARRGLPSSRAAKAVMVQRLVENDDSEQESADLAEAPPSGPETVAPASAVKTEQPAPEPAVSLTTFRQTFQAEPDGPDEESHLAYRQATIAAAAEAGLQPRGDARLAETDGGVWVYEVSVRQVT
jgi:hypothetical protein